MEKIKIYASKTCPYCKQVKEHLDENKIEYDEIITSENGDEWNDVTNIVGMGTLPTIHFMNEYFVAGRDFPNPQVLVNIIQSFKGNTDYQKLLWERFKTLNYNISMIFNKINNNINQVHDTLNKNNTDEHESTS
tara:strand:- start:29 stop:430 length:402 start_codon:yes stop_codon:yes gene_type:complete